MFSCCKSTLPSPKSLHVGFKLPIEYVDPAQVHVVPKQVADDLELDTMYAHLLTPKHEFAKKLVVEWNKKFSTSQRFLRDTQTMISNIPLYLENVNKSSRESTSTERITEIWKDTKEDVRFLEKYSFVEWDALRSMNESSTFLQAMSVINMSSPILSFIMPIIFFIFPFLLLKIQGVPITFTTYIDVLKQVAKHHFIGSFIQNIQSISLDKLVYLLMTVGMYLLQIYQNYNLCIRFYANVNRMNTNLCDLRGYVSSSISDINAFVKRNENLTTYAEFCKDAQQQSDTLSRLRDELKSIEPFKAGFSKITEIGYMLKCYYKLHSDVDYENSLRYAVGFDGFIGTLEGVSNNIQKRLVSLAEFTDADKCEFVKQYYPAYVSLDHVKNNCDFHANMVITGPNASGKTTIIKTTLLNIIFTQQFGCGFYKACSINPYTHIHSYLNIPDTSGRDSLFQAESRRCKDILDIINAPENVNARHFCIFDELYSGTNPTEAISAARAFLCYLVDKQNVSFMLTTHYVSLCRKLKGRSGIENYKMNMLATANELRPTYKLRRGISKIKGGLAILEAMEYPVEIINMIRGEHDIEKCIDSVYGFDII